MAVYTRPDFRCLLKALILLDCYAFCDLFSGKKLRLILLLWLFISLKGFAAESVRSLASGNCSSTFTDEWSLYHNPAGPAWFKKSFFSFSSVNHYLLRELTENRVAFALAGKNKVFGITSGHSGDSRLTYNKAALVYSQLFSDIFSMGIGLNYEEMSFSDIYGQHNGLYVTFGFLIRLKNKSRFAFHLINPERKKLYENSVLPLNSHIVTAYTFAISPLFEITVEMDKTPGLEANFKTGLNYRMSPAFECMMGYETAFRRTGCGFSYQFKKARIQMSFSYQYLTGFNAGLGFSMLLGKKQ